MTSLTKKLKPKYKNFFSLQTQRFAKSFMGLDNCLAHLAPELCPRKDTGKLLDFSLKLPSR